MLEDKRRRTYTVVAHVGWWGALGLTAGITTNLVPRTFGVCVIFLVGVAISCGLTLSRAHLTDTICRVLEVGMSLPRQEVRDLMDNYEYEVPGTTTDNNDESEPQT